MSLTNEQLTAIAKAHIDKDRDAPDNEGWSIYDHEFLAIMRAVEQEAIKNKDEAARHAAYVVDGLLDRIVKLEAELAKANNGWNDCLDDKHELEAERDLEKTSREQTEKLLHKQAETISRIEAERDMWQGDYVRVCDELTVIYQERDALAMQNKQMREALSLWKIASDNSEECEFDDMAANAIPMPLFCDADEATEAALALPDLFTETIKRHDAELLDRSATRLAKTIPLGSDLQDCVQALSDWADELEVK